MPRFLSSHIKCVLLLVVITVITGCKNLPDGVLGKKEMADLLIDIHKGESVVEMQRGIYRNDSLRKVVKQSILLKHGVTQAQLDTSFVYYGNHIEDYLEIYDDVIKKLEEELTTAKGSKGNIPVFAEGDSVDVWQLPHLYRLSADDELQNIMFNIAKDDTWKPGDNYMLKFKVVNSRQQSPKFKAVMYARYDDGRLELRPSTSLSNNWIKVRLVTDSAMMPESVFGAIAYTLDKGETVYLDSISLVRTRNRKDTYNERHGQRTVRNL